LISKSFISTIIIIGEYFENEDKVREYKILETKKAKYSDKD